MRKWTYKVNGRQHRQAKKKFPPAPQTVISSCPFASDGEIHHRRIAFSLGSYSMSQSIATGSKTMYAL